LAQALYLAKVKKWSLTGGPCDESGGGLFSTEESDNIAAIEFDQPGSRGFTMDQQSMSAGQFGAKASNYLTSVVHSTGADLERLNAMGVELQPESVLDLGCGAGHVSFSLAQGGAHRITAYDPSAEMLQIVRQAASERGFGKAIDTCVGSAEVLPFESNTFDLVVSRYSAHHWTSVPRALGECARVLTPGGRVVIIDVIAPENPLCDTALQVLEFLRDPSHVRDYRVSEWSAMVKAAGLGEPAASHWKLPIEFKSWIARIGTPSDRVAALESVFSRLPSEVVEYFQIGLGNSFVIDSVWIEATQSS
jgi:ubiquinone/menaquinone biosynthesis C-methylase UbiE